MIKTVQVQCQTRHDQPTIKNRRAPMEIIIWVSERKERGRERRQDDSKHDQIEFLFALAHGRNIDRRKAAGMARKEKKNSERERERERWPFKSPRRSFIERVERSVFPIRHESFRRSHENFTLPFLPPCFSLSSFLQPLVALHLNSPSKEVLP